MRMPSFLQVFVLSEKEFFKADWSALSYSKLDVFFSYAVIKYPVTTESAMWNITYNAPTRKLYREFETFLMTRRDI